ncbi:MAG: SDR family NAD(P)-dependent oxidoreductase [Clostridium sp.]|nr:SDR family NAD(P)-dependent oxidoreductase [Clostridium sp.]
MRIAIVTGASSGLGVEFTRTIINKYKYLDEIWIIARRKERLVQIADENKDIRIRPISMDLSKNESFLELEGILKEENPHIDILINNAGYEKIGSVLDMNMSDILSIVDINIKGMTALSRICLPYMKKGSFEIITSSVSSFSPVPNQTIYSASKKYVYYFGRSLREEMKKAGVNVLILCPGNMDTEMNPRGKMTHSKQINLLPYLNMKAVTENSLKRAQNGKAVYTPGAFYKFYRICSKIMPSAFMIKITKRFF